MGVGRQNEIRETKDRNSQRNREEEKEERWREGRKKRSCWERFRRLKKRQTQEGIWEVGEYEHASGQHGKRYEHKNKRERWKEHNRVEREDKRGGGREKQY